MYSPATKANLAPYAQGKRWTLYAGDVLEVLPALRREAYWPTALVTDPPFATAGGNTNGRDSGADDQFWGHWFRSVWGELALTLPVEGCGFVFSDWRMIAALQRSVSGGIDRQRAKAWQVSQALVWDRESIGLGAPFRAGFEMIGFVRGPSWVQDPRLIPKNLPAVIRHRWPYGSHPNHGAEKPVDLLRQLVRWTGGTMVLDPFAGSGSTGVAAIAEGRGFVGIEREPRYLEIAARRMVEAEAGLDHV
jgi:site-specific DNA-methyltransferase (adenine-specific)